MRTLAAFFALASLLPAPAAAQSPAKQSGVAERAFGFTFTLDGIDFTYTDAETTFTGILVKPAGDGPFPAVIVSHGQGGSALGYSLAKANEFLAWGVVSIAPNYTHAAGGSTAPATTGDCPENVARGLKCLHVLKTLPYVDSQRLALWGHSKGAYVTIGLAAAAPGEFRAAGMSSGGVIPDAAGTQNAAPTVSEASPTTAPFIMFHGTGDPVVNPMQSLLFQQTLDAHGVANLRILYATSEHNLHQVPSINADMLSRFHDWLEDHGVLP
ncbi:MAG TPA: prolyl oligopeptidase family serine peptidase [Planctomycetota bacterium]|nr:prolyl oligopeptidase family serine peptidase [Planctomycetota bacterium]